MIRRAVAALALLLPVALAAPPAHADPRLLPITITVEGSGVIAPGLPCFNCGIAIAFDAVTAGSLAGVDAGCGFAGNSYGLDTELSGAGAGVVGGCGLAGNLSYTRTGAVVTLAGRVTVSGLCFDVTTGVLAFVPTSVNPISTFLVAGTVVLSPC
jgi:hypothetical protein